MSDSVDRVFVHALATVRRLPRTGSSRPPPASRLRLYGLYKQSMEGDVESILARPTLPSSSPSSPEETYGSGSANSNNNNNNSVHRYASRDLRTREAQAEIEKWDAWHACAGMSRTEAKRQYITTLIETMKEYASGTAESRELVSELEFVWNQIKSQSGSDPDDEAGRNNGGGSNASNNQESRTRQLERAGLKQTESYASIPPGRRDGRQDSRDRSKLNSDFNNLSRLQNTTGLRVLSPISQPEEDERSRKYSPARSDDDERHPELNDNDDDDENQPLDTAPTSPLVRSQLRPAQPPDLMRWHASIESHLRSLQNEIAALREQLSAHYLLTPAPYTTYTSLSRRRRFFHRLSLYSRLFVRHLVRQSLAQLLILLLCLLWGRWRGDRRLEMWIRRKVAGLWTAGSATRNGGGEGSSQLRLMGLGRWLRIV